MTLLFSTYNDLTKLIHPIFGWCVSKRKYYKKESESYKKRRNWGSMKVHSWQKDRKVKKKEKAPSLNSKRSSQTNKCSITYLQRTWYSKKIITKRDSEMVKTKESLLFKSPLQVNVFPSPILQWQNWKKKRRDMRENKLPWSCKHAVDPTPASQTLCCQLHYV